MGCKCCNNHNGGGHCRKEKGNATLRRKITVQTFSFALLAIGLLFHVLQVPFFNGPIRLFWYAAAFVPVALPVVKDAMESIRERDFFNEFTLMLVASLGAFCIGEYPEGVAVMLFYSVGEMLQDYAVGRAKRNIKALLDVRPDMAVVIDGGQRNRTRVEDVPVGVVIEVKAGERVPLDGMLLGERASFNTSALTGESVPRRFETGEEVLAGMIAVDRVVQLRVSKLAHESALSRILAMVENASERKARTELFIRKFARVYTPVVFALAVAIVSLPFLWSLSTPDFEYVFNDWLYRGLVFLVISCPCALVVSVPLGYFGGIGAASKAGILFKGGNYLDAMAKLQTVVFDKTGTLTEGTFCVRKMESTLPEHEFLSVLAAMEQNSNHPISSAIADYAASRGIVELPRVEKSEEIAGFGLKAVVGGNIVLVGNLKLLERENVSCPAELADEVETLVVCAIDGLYAGYLVLADKPKQDAAVAIENLKKEGISDTVILSGDRSAIVERLRAALGITRGFGELLPEGKVEKMEQIKAASSGGVAFVGDGINDAPVLACSDVGMAMGGLGSDAAIETADVVIQTDQPSKVAEAVRIGKTTRKIVLQNIIFSISVKFVVLALGALGDVNLWVAVFADVGVALLAVFNALRIPRSVRNYGISGKSCNLGTY